MMTWLLRPSFWLVLSLVFYHVAEARQFRKMAPIPVAPEVLSQSIGKQGGQQAGVLEAIDPKFIEQQIEAIVGSWNKAELRDYLDKSFPSRWQLVSVLSRDIPQDATLTVLAVQNINTINQQWENTTPGQRVRVSSVVATVNMQIRFVDSRKGLITLPHTSQFYLQVVDSES